ncbi:hypothetical protein ACIPL1_24480 [Pseudomonas sp. NPDC090202]|uniref:hypothetical protein n=1 Tax=unclassified Pseudomonas TaxID=196821 RepID=UPI003809CE97
MHVILLGYVLFIGSSVGLSAAFDPGSALMTSRDSASDEAGTITALILLAPDLDIAVSILLIAGVGNHDSVGYGGEGRNHSIPTLLYVSFSQLCHPYAINC